MCVATTVINHLKRAHNLLDSSPYLHVTHTSLWRCELGTIWSPLPQMREFKIVFAFSFFLSIVRDSVVAGTVAADVSPHFNLPRIDNSTERINYSLFFEGITKTDGQPEGQNNPKQVLTGESFHAQLTTGEALDHASLMGWDIGVATATNGRGYSNQDNFLIRLYSEVVPEKEKEQPRFRPTIGLFAVFDGHGRYGHIASRTAMETTRQLADAAFSNYAELVEKGWAHIRQMAKFGYVVNETIPMEPSVIEQSIQKFIMDIYRNVEEALMQGSELGKFCMKLLIQCEYGNLPHFFHPGTTMTLVVWDLKQQKLYAASAGDSLAFKGNSESKTLDLISADHGANNPAEQDRIRKAMQNYFRIPPRKSSFEGKITVVWQTPGEYDGWPDELKSYGVVSPTDEGWTPSEQDLESRKMDEDEDEKDHGFGDVEISEIIANDTSTAKPTLSSSQNPTTVDKAPSALSLLQLGLSTTSAPTETNNTSTGDSVDTNPFVRMILEMMSLPTIRGERIMPG